MSPFLTCLNNTAFDSSSKLDILPSHLPFSKSSILDFEIFIVPAKVALFLIDSYNDSISLP
jgi:hypothetical protein